MQGDFFLTTWFLEAMKWIYQNVGSVFLTVLISTFVLKAVTVFSDISNRKSSLKMAAIQPEVQKIQKKYKSDPRKAQAEQSKLMKERGVSMWSSCLPVLITMPLFFCFIAAFRFWGYEMTLKLLVLPSDEAMELFKSFKFLWINNIWQADNGTMPVILNGSTFLATADLPKLLYLYETPGVWQKLIDLGIAAASTANGVTTYSILTTDAAIAAYDAAMSPFINVYSGMNNGWFIMPVVAAGTNLLSSWMMQKNQPQQAAASPDGQQNPLANNKLMMYMFPIMSFVVCLTSNAAFAIYWTLSSIMMITINLILNKFMPRTNVVEVKK